jgi:hypothetical protein
MATVKRPIFALGAAWRRDDGQRRGDHQFVQITDGAGSFRSCLRSRQQHLPASPSLSISSATDGVQQREMLSADPAGHPQRLRRLARSEDVGSAGRGRVAAAEKRPKRTDAEMDTAGDGDDRSSRGGAEAHYRRPGEAAVAGAGQERQLLGGRTPGGAILQISWMYFTYKPLYRIAITNFDPI